MRHHKNKPKYFRIVLEPFPKASRMGPWPHRNRPGAVLVASLGHIEPCWPRLVASCGRLVAVLASQMPPNGRPKTFAFRSHGGGSVLGSQSVGKILRKSFQKSQNILAKTTPNPTKILSERGFSTETKKSSFFSLFVAPPGRVLGGLGGVLGAPWGVLGASWGRLGGVLGPS